MATRQKNTTAAKAVTFNSLKQSYAKARGVTLDTVEGANACKAMRQYIRTNRASLIDAGWKSLADHQKGAQYGDVPAPVAAMIVKRERFDTSSDS